jgi:nucleoside-diphosphate-sugar epimerase
MVIKCRLLKEWPNTYAFTKAIAEAIVQEFGKGLPIAVVRPAVGENFIILFFFNTKRYIVIYHVSSYIFRSFCHFLTISK